MYGEDVIDDVILKGHAHNMQSVLNRIIKSLHVNSPMVHQMAQEAAQCPSAIIRLGPNWHNTKISWANTVN